MLQDLSFRYEGDLVCSGVLWCALVRSAYILRVDVCYAVGPPLSNILNPYPIRLLHVTRLKRIPE